MKSKYTPRNVKKFGRMKSSEFNEMNKELSYEFYELRSRMLENETIFSNILNQIRNENVYLENKIADIENSIENLEKNNSILYTDFYDDGHLHFGEGRHWEIDEQDRAEVFYNYSAVLPKMHTKIPKNYLYKANNEAFVPEDINIEVTNRNVHDEVLEVNESDPVHAIDQNLNTAWYKEYIYDEDKNIEKIEVDYELDLPQTVFTNMHSNCIMINTYPDFACDIEDIKYKTITSSDYKSFNDYKIKTDASNNKLLIFEEMDVSSFIITLSSDQPISAEGQKQKFTVGTKNIAVYNMRFHEQGNLFVEFNTEGIEQINDVDIGISNKLETEGVEYTIYGINNQTGERNEIKQNEYISTNFNNDIVVELEITDSDIIPPVISYIALDYS